MHREVAQGRAASGSGADPQGVPALSSDAGEDLVTTGVLRAFAGCAWFDGCLRAVRFGSTAPFGVVGVALIASAF